MIKYHCLERSGRRDKYVQVKATATPGKQFIYQGKNQKERQFPLLNNRALT